MINSPKTTPIKSFPSKLRFVFTCALLALLAACGPTIPAPEYTDPLTDIGKARKNFLFSNLSLGVIYSENTQKSMDHVREGRELITSFGALTNATALSDLDPHYLTERMNKILESNFKEVIVIKNLAEAERENNDLVMKLDIRIKLGKRSGHESSVDITGIFVSAKNQAIDTVSGKGTSTVPYPAWTFQFKPASNVALQSFDANLNESDNLAAEAKRLSKTTTVVVSQPKVKTDTTPPSIVITSHKTGRGLKIVENLSRTQIIGQAIDPSGVAEVKINGEPTSLDAEGYFKGDVFLKVGENGVLITAMDTQENYARKEFIIIRNPKTAMVRQSDVVQDGDFGRFYALIIGNNNYQHISKLETARNDAKELDVILREKYGFETEVLLDAKRDDILKSLNRFRNKLESNDSFLLYYAGHGEFEKNADKAYWLPVDAKPNDDTKWIIVDSITSNIKRFSSNHVLVIADSCYSGTMTRSATSQVTSTTERDKYLKKMLKKVSRTLIASGGNEPVSDSGGEGHSIFSDVLLKSLNTAEQKVFTAEELFYGSIKESVAGRADQTPEYSIIRHSGHDGGDFLFVKN